MAFATTAIKYGWVYLTALGVITGTTIYVVNNTRQQVKPEDIIPIALGTDERATALQTGTNGDGSPIYPVARPSFVRTWTSNVYATNGVTVYTNIATNTIGWHPDRDMMVSLDTTIKALVPYYVDTNSVYDGTTNIVMLTVTGLWASLGIGDKTNQFTREPAWTNPVSTNWVVNYTSYWPSTNGVAVTNGYTSDYQQVINYAASWTATGGHVWVTSSNWASEVVTVTNAATYGDYPWQIYVEDLQERYKVLNALKYTPASVVWSSSNDVENLYPTNIAWSLSNGDPNHWYEQTKTWQEVKDICEGYVSYGPYAYGWVPLNYPCDFSEGYSGDAYIDGWIYKDWYHWARCSSEYYYPKITVPFVSTSIVANCSIFIYALVPGNWEWESFFESNKWVVLESFVITNTGIVYGSKVGNNILDYNWPIEPYTPNWPDPPVSPIYHTNLPPQSINNVFAYKGWFISNKRALIDWQFNYCTNAYWN